MSRVWRHATALPLAALVVLLLVWWVGHSSTRFIPSPVDVLWATPGFLRQPDLLKNLLATISRVYIGLGIAVFAALVTVLLMSWSKRVERVLQVYVFVTLSIPSIAAALFSLMIFGISSWGVYTAVAVITFPFITIGIRDGAASVDPHMLEMAQVYRFGLWRRFRHITIPYMEPYLLAALRNANALAWKVAIIAEVFMSVNGIGAQFMRSFDFFNLEEVIFWLGIFLVCVFIVEYGILRQVERRLFRWRQSGPTRTVAG